MVIARKLLTAVAPLLLTAPAWAQDKEEPRRPNLLIILADDLGYSDIGAFGGEIATPNLDALAARGLKLTGLHVAPTCSPTRSMLLTGLDNHQAGLGSMAELLAPNQKGKPGHEGYLRPDTATLAELLGAAGYRTHYSGKWHLGLKPDQVPSGRGFQTSFALLQGASNHFGADVGKAAGMSAYTVTYLENAKPVTTLPKTFYSSDYFATKLIDQLKAGKSRASGKQPFFAYLAFTAPHYPLHAPPETVAKYKGRYDAGYEVLRRQRLKRQVELGLLNAKVVPHDFDLAPRWDTLSLQEKARSSRRMEVYAAMVDRLDWNVGRVVQALKQTGELDNTEILFLSDNGAEGAILWGENSTLTRARTDEPDNSVANLGAASSYDAIGPGWAEAAAAPSWRVKGFETEGGTRTVSFLTGPGVKPGIHGTFTSVMDVVPTFLDFAHIPQPGARFQGREVQPIRGKSWLPWLGGRTDRVYPIDEPVGAELFGGRVVRKGDWKLLDHGDGQWRLYDIAADPGETRDLAARDPERVEAMEKEWQVYARQVGVVLPDGPQKIVTRPARR